MKKARNEKLSEHLLNVEEEILVNAYEVNSSEKLQRYIKEKNKNKEKVFSVAPVFRKAIAVAACFLVAMSALVFAPAPPVDDPEETAPISHESADKETDEVLYVYGDGVDLYAGTDCEIDISRNEIFISPTLQEKMQTYHGTEAVFRVIVEIFITAEDYNEFTKTDEYSLSLRKQMEEAMEAYKKVKASLAGVSDESKRSQIVIEIKEKEKEIRELDRMYDQRLLSLQATQCEQVASNRLDAASKRSKKAPIPISNEPGVLAYAAYNQYAYFMDLTEEDINALAKQGGYLFRLAAAPKDVPPSLDFE